MRILSIGPMDGLSNTCLHRHWALTKYAGLIDVVNTSGVKSSLWYKISYHLFLYGIPIRVPESNHENDNIRFLVDKNLYDLVWVDKGITTILSRSNLMQSLLVIPLITWRCVITRHSNI